jgi:hypothetical protein
LGPADEYSSCRLAIDRGIRTYEGERAYSIDGLFGARGQGLMIGGLSRA